jgi:broad specificity phosphatase PhoE
MRTAILARHGESDMNTQDALSSDVDAAVDLSLEGERQARRLGAELAREPIELCLTSMLLRARRTAALALEGRDVPTAEWPELNDPRYGAFEGGPLRAYREWAWAHGSADVPPGDGESRHVIVTRYGRAFRRVLDRPEDVVLVVAHSLPLAYLLAAAEGTDPARRMQLVEYATAYRLDAAALGRAVERLEAWCAAPTW